MQQAILAGSHADTGAHVCSDERLSAEGRIAIYVQSYRQRLLECLRTEYPLLAALAGPTAFDLFAQGYIAAHPSHSYTLYDFGARFADYLERSRPQGPPDAVEAIPAALARIERAQAEVLRARGVEYTAGVSDAAQLDPAIAGILGRRVYCRPDSVRLLSLPFDFTATLAAAARREPPRLPELGATLLSVVRVSYRVECFALEEWQYAWLLGLPTVEAAPRFAATSVPQRIDAQVAAWLPWASRYGLVTAQ